MTRSERYGWIGVNKVGVGCGGVWLIKQMRLYIDNSRDEGKTRVERRIGRVLSGCRREGY